VAVWEAKDDGDTLQRFGLPTAPEAKAAFNLRLNVAAFIRHWGRNHCLFFTLTDEHNLHPTQFARRWNHYRRRQGTWIRSFIRVLEPQKSGRPHYHVLVAVPWDTCPDAFDWNAFYECQQERQMRGKTARFRELRDRYRNSAASEIVKLWSLLRKILPRYGLGRRSELLPLRKDAEAVSEYVGKYLEAGLTLRKHSWKGCRRIEFDRTAKALWQSCTREFAWHSLGAKAWRARVGQLAAAVGARDLNDIRRKFGRRWGYRFRSAITLASESDWQMLMQNFSGENAIGLHGRQWKAFQE
jgi:hypothetical protein